MAGIYIVNKAEQLNIRELWEIDGSAPECFRATMSRVRFSYITASSWFDDTENCNEGKKTYSIPICQVSEKLVSRCKSFYKVGEYLPINESMEAFRGSKFQQYIANKPSKYIIKIYALTNTRIYYI